MAEYVDDTIEDEEPTNLYIIMWCMEGLECVINLTDLEEENSMRLLSDEPPRNIGSLLHTLTLRARFNTPRRYEIYSIRVSEGITEEDMTKFFNSDPQSAVNMIRERGRQLYSDRAKGAPVII